MSLLLAIDCSTHDKYCCRCSLEWDGTVCRPEDGSQCGFDPAADCLCEDGPGQVFLTDEAFLASLEDDLPEDAS